MKYKIKNLGTIVTGHTPSTENNEYWNSNDIPFVCPADLKGSRYINATERFVSNTVGKDFKSVILPVDSVMISCIGYIGYVGITTKPSISNQQINTIVNIKKQIVSPLYLYYLLVSKKTYLVSIGNNGTTLPIIKKTLFENIELDVASMEEQQHIVDTIGSVDDLIEKYQCVENKIIKFGELLFAKISSGDKTPIIRICSFNKGREIGSLNYSDKGEIPYLRVSNLDSQEYDTYTTKQNDAASCKSNDILIALDGAPGRVSYGLEGYYSSGIYKIICDEKIKGYIYFYLISDECQNVIKSNAVGTTILHASKSIKEMTIPKCTAKNIEDFNDLFNYLVIIKEKINSLKHEKWLLLQKYFN